MNVLQALFLALIQGITEFLPVSSSGHLVLFQKFFHLNSPPVLFDILLHLGSLGAIIVFFWKDVWSLVVNWRRQKRTWLLLIIGSVPAAFFGFFLNSKIETIFGSLTLVGLMWIIFGLLLLLTRKIKLGNKKIEKGDVGVMDALTVGIFQGAALFPGISRSGSTISGGLYRKLSPETAFKYSFLLSIPAILGATLLGGMHTNLGGVSPLAAFLAVGVAGVVGYFALRLLQNILKSNRFYLFGFYCLAIGLLAVFLAPKF